MVPPLSSSARRRVLCARSGSCTHSVAECRPPNPELYGFEGRLVFPPRAGSSGGTGSAWVRRASESWSDVYDAEIDLCDAMLQRVLDALDRAGHGEDTVLCVTSDHGEEFLDHGLV